MAQVIMAQVIMAQIKIRYKWPIFNISIEDFSWGLGIQDWGFERLGEIQHQCAIFTCAILPKIETGSSPIKFH